MGLPRSVEALINERTGKYFILLDDQDADDGKVKVINPVGDVIEVTTALFRNDDPQIIQDGDFQKYFTDAQIQKLSTWEQEAIQAAERERIAKAARSGQQSVARSAPKARAGSSRRDGIIDKSTSSVGKRAKVEWDSDGLVFYRHKIEVLGTNDVFAVNIKGKGRFQISKAEFKRVFNNIIMSPGYRSQGIYRYDELPEEALPFIK